MHIVICGSMQFAKEMLNLKSHLEEMGHAVELPKDAERYATGEKDAERKWEKIQGDVIRGHFEKIKHADAVLIANYSKNGIEYYIGGNSLLEMGFAHVLGKKIYLLHPIPAMQYSDEIASMQPVILNDDFSQTFLQSLPSQEGESASGFLERPPLARERVGESAGRDDVVVLDPRFTYPRVGIDILILKDGKVLAGKRKGAHGAGEYSFPGGSLEMMESYADCARRETMEECGVKIKNIRFNFTANSFHFTPRHYVCIGLIAEWESGEPTVMEPDKCESWDWYDLDELPEPMFIYCRLAIESYQTQKICIDSDGTDLSEHHPIHPLIM